MKILITGAAGFFGSNLCEYLLAKGHTVVGYDNFNNFYDPKIKEFNIKDFKDHASFKLYRKDILDVPALEDCFMNETPAVVVHLAAWAGVTKSIDEPAVYVRNNVEGTVNVLEAAIKSGTGNFIFASTSSVYGINPTPFSENTPTDAPLSPYPATKKACEVMLKAYAINKDINVTVLRIFNPIGPRLRPDLLLPKLIRSCIYEGFECPVYWTPEDLGKIKRDYTYINHMFEAIERIMETPFKYEIFNMGNSAPISLVEMFAAVERVVGKKPMTKLMPHRQGEMLETYADIQKAKAELGYNPITSIEDSIKLFYDWFMLQDDAYKKGNL